jgi:hypothetical protein
VGISDLTVAVSVGVAAALRENVPRARIETVTNGCDYEEYSRYRPDEHLTIAAKGWDRVAVYAGNINARLDFVLLERSVRTHPTMLYVFVGPITGLETEDAVRWGRLLREPNVRYFEERDPADLPGLYGAADVGIVPYKQTRVLVENGFPLKVLEMCATGLPVVSTLMKPIVGLCEGLVVVRDHEDFIEMLSRTSRASLTSVQKEEMSRVCQQHDYDRKFATVLSLLQEPGRDTEPSETTKVDGFLLQLPTNQWSRLGLREWRERSSRASRPPVGGLLPERVLKGMLAARVILRDSTLRGLLLSGAVYRCRGVRIGLSGLVADLFRLAILRDSVLGVTPLGFPLEVRLQYDRQEERLVVRTIASGHAPATSPPGIHSPPPKQAPMRAIVWDHSAIGTALRINATGRPAWLFMGADGQYNFQALTVLAQQHLDSVWDAFCPRRAADR